ncbi:AUGMIN subunit 2-like isoform X3 [Cynara cardunculus var. scolymus]|uniref:AUGMIN subunit 2-like isoform X3 n=1 Tax=Cynara cardunculus var. scolymus TaxID=59895 RepID=UPI000D623B05|nr:AUGMIN subunit 2-like isoform X3 [Cynara cardunculus var. scolymus]
MASVYGSDSRWVEEKPTRQNGGMSDALSIAAHIGFPVLSPPSQNLSFRIGETSYDFIRILHELTTLQGKVSDLQVQLHGRKDRIIARLQQPHLSNFIPVEAEYQKQFVELIMNAASDYGTLTTSVSDLQWAQNFKEPPSVWGEMLRPIPVALAQCARYFEAMNAMRESFATLQKLRTYSSQLPSEYHSRITSPIDSECVSPCSSRTGLSSDDLDLRSVINQDVEKQQEEDDKYTDVDDINDIRLAWPSGNENDL